MTGGAQRIGDAIDLLAKGYAKRLLISGVNENTSRDQIARLNPGQRRLFDCCVDLDYRARNTIGNAIETRRWAERNGFDALIVVTSNYHMPRTLVELDHALPNLQKIPYPVAATIDPHEWWHNPSVTRVIFTEYLKFLAVWLRTRFEGDPESVLRGADHQRRLAHQGTAHRRTALALEPPRENPLWCRARGASRSAFRFQEAMLIVRSLLFNVAFYANLILWLIILIPGFLVPRRVFIELRQGLGPDLPLAAARHRRNQGRDPRPGEDPAGRGSGRGQAPVVSGNLRPADALRRPDLHPQARADVDPVLRLVSWRRRAACPSTARPDRWRWCR